MTTPAYPIEDTLAGARGAAASLAQIATTLADAAACAPPTPEAVRHVAATLQASAQRAALGCMSLAAHAGRLEAFAVVGAAAIESARAAVEREAEHDAALYLRAVRDDGETQAPEQWAADAFAGTLEDDGAEAFAPLDVDEARARYVAEFVRIVAALR